MQKSASYYLNRHYQELDRDDTIPKSTRLAMKDLLLRSTLVALDVEEQKKEG